MLHRVEGDNVIIISQPAHAWVSGQLARVWGNELFGDFLPYEEVCLAAALHDVGFLDWEAAPTLNHKTGLPHTFMDMPTALHLEIWSKGIQQVLKYNRYTALLVSMHFTHLCRKYSSQSSEDKKHEAKFLKAQDELQTTLVTSLRNDVDYDECSDEDVIQRNRQLVSTWDWISLVLCMGFQGEKVESMPSADGMTEVKLRRAGESKVVIEPWPFRVDSVTIKCEGLELLKRYSDEPEMRKALQAASPVPIRVELVRA